MHDCCDYRSLFFYSVDKKLAAYYGVIASVKCTN